MILRSSAVHRAMARAHGKHTCRTLVTSGMCMLGLSGILAFSQTSRPEKLSARFDRWLNEEVVYIICPEERKSFLALKSDPERLRFVRQFWELRKPRPNADENDFKEEHYRRLAYANDHFACDVAGWKTDRGRIYIGYGPPAEIAVVHIGSPSTEAATAETWRYKYIDYFGGAAEYTFTSERSTCDYKLSGHSEIADGSDLRRMCAVALLLTPQEPK